MLSAQGGATRVLLVRHGRTAANAAGLLSGRHDVALDDEGRAQAAAVAGALATRLDGSGATLVSSPLRRATETAEIIADVCPEAGSGDGVVLDERFIELDYGDWDGVRLGDVPAEAWRRWRSDPAFCPPGGETLAAVAERVADALTEWTRDFDGGTLVVTSHVSPIKAAVTWALGVGDGATWRLRLSNASICELLVDIDARGVAQGTVVGFNDTAHLGGPG